MVKTYHKLVRDKIPQIVEAGGSRCVVRRLEEEEYLRLLDEKLNEELAEYQQSKEMEELADLLEVIEATAKARGCSWEELWNVKQAKKEKRGGFAEKLLLMEVSSPEE